MRRRSPRRPAAATWCDLGCLHAGFPKRTALQGACNTMQALWCRKHKRLVPKNGVCLGR